jgi:hypothetical protein
MTTPTQFSTTMPASNAALRASLFAGELYHLGSTPSSRELVARARGLLHEALADVDDDVRRAPSRLTNEVLFERMGKLRKRLYMGEDFHALLRGLLTELGWDLDRVAFDPLRLRIIIGDGHANPAAKAVYYPHRDTWYGHPQSLVVGWIPLDDLLERETFVFYPEYLSRIAANDSEIFDYDTWVRDGWSLKIGWQDPEAGLRARYPQMTEPIAADTQTLGFACEAADVVLFAGAQLHQTRAQIGDRTRYSLDFRVVDLDDVAAGRGAPNVDSRARGSAVPDYVRGA